jgi:predicted TIM-barrel fold metal-dependent hydrolase
VCLGLIDTGHRARDILGVPEIPAIANVSAHEVIRIEAVMEAAAKESVSGRELLAMFERMLADRAAGAVALKSIVAYRTTFDIEQTPPSRSEAVAAGDAWLKANEVTGWCRLEDSTLIRHALFVGLEICAERNFPLQLHVGVGDSDVNMPKCDPTVFIPFVLKVEAKHVPVTLLHCYPFVQESAWMAEVFSNVYYDVGFTLNFTGPLARRIMEEALGMGPFFKHLYSSDAFGLAELHHLGSIQFQRTLSAVLTDWIASDECDAKQAERIAAMISHENAERIYRL